MPGPADRARAMLLAGATPGGAAGNAVSSEVMLAALRRLGPVDTLSHGVSALPTARRVADGDGVSITLGALPVLVHGEAIPAGHLHRAALRRWSCGWAVNSRYAGALAAARVPYAIWEPTTLRDELASTSGLAARRAGRGSGLGAALHRVLLPADERLERWLYRRAARLCVMSEYARERIVAIHGIAAERMDVLAHPPTPAYLDALAAAEAEPRARDRSAPGGARLLFVGRADDPRKNFPLLLAAIRHLVANGVACSLTVVGPHTEQWRRGLALHGIAERVTFAGRVTLAELARAYLTHDLLVLPSRQEGFGIVVAEAMHAGLPVVVTRCGGPEAIIRDSGGGELVAHDARAIADAIARIAADPARWLELARRGRAFARSELSFDRFAERVEEITMQVLGARAVFTG